MKIYGNISQTVGHTPLVRLERIEKLLGLDAELIAKVESNNPGGSIKDRIAKYIMEEAEARGELVPGATIIEPTSGNTGIGIAMMAAIKGYKAIIVIPSSMSRERQMLMRAYGAEVRLTDGSLGMQGAIDEAHRLAALTPNAYLFGQFTNPKNPEAHYRSTGPEIYEDTDGDIDIFVCAAGTGGSLSGTGKYLKEQRSDIKIIAAEPKSSPVISGGKPAPHKIQGIGAGFIPEVLDTALIDKVVQVSDEDAFAYAKMLGNKEGILCGISSGAALAAATEVARTDVGRGKRIVLLLPDTGERYLSAGLFD